MGKQAIGATVCIIINSKETSILGMKGITFESLDFEMQDI